MTYNHRILKADDGTYRCSTCRRASRSRTFLENNVPCSISRPQEDTEEKDSGPVWKYAEEIEPAFPSLGDTWREMGTNNYYVWARPMGVGRAPEWIELSTGTIKPGQLSLTGNGTNPALRTYNATTSVSQEILVQGDESRITNHTLVRTWAAVLAEMLEERAVPVGLAEVRIGIDRATDAKTFTVSILGRPIPKGVYLAWGEFVQSVNMQELPNSFKV